MQQVGFLTLTILVGVITRYNAEPGDPLKCFPAGDVRYGDPTTPYLALDIQGLGETWQCGDEGLAYIEGYPPVRVLVFDSGRFKGKCVMQLDGSCPDIIGDLPTRFASFTPDLSARGRIVLVSAAHRAMEAYR